MKWSQIKKRTENRFAPSVRGRFDFQVTQYRQMRYWFRSRGWLSIDGCEILNLTVTRYVAAEWTEEQGYIEDLELQNANIFCGTSLPRELRDSLDMSIEAAMTSEETLIRAFAMLDARLGKRRLLKMKMEDEHDLVRRLYYLRCEAEGLTGIKPPPGDADLILPLKMGETVLDRRRAQAAEARKQAPERLSTGTATRKLDRLLRHLEGDELTEDELDTPLSRGLFEGFQKAVDRSQLRNNLQFLASCSQLLDSPRLARGAAQLTCGAAAWIRPLAEWSPQTHNRDRQFSSLARHLYARYDVPPFMDSTWTEGDDLEQDWFRHIGGGGNIRTAEGLPLPLTRKMAHYFLEAPDGYRVLSAFRWGQVMALGGDPPVADSLLGTRVVEHFDDDPFWLSFLRFLVRNPMLDPVHVGPIVDYIWHQRFEPQLAVADGDGGDQRPPQPNFSMGGRTAASMLQAVENWHRLLGRAIPGGRLKWKKSTIPNFELRAGGENSSKKKVWRIRELLSSNELIHEGRELKHCVASYADSCAKGRNSIWSMEFTTDGGVTKALTIELDNSSRMVRQARGECDRLATPLERDVIFRWAQQADLTVAPHV